MFTTEKTEEEEIEYQKKIKKYGRGNFGKISR